MVMAQERRKVIRPEDAGCKCADCVRKRKGRG